MIRWLGLLGALLVVAGPARAQQPNAQRLREQVMQRFLQNYVEQAGLDEGQKTQFGDAIRRTFEQRQELQNTQRQILRAMEGQMRPGVAADQDSLMTLLDELVDIQMAQAALASRQRTTSAGFLDPVQQAQLVLALSRLDRQIQEIVRRRAEARRQQ